MYLRNRKTSLTAVLEGIGQSVVCLLSAHTFFRFVLQDVDVRMNYRIDSVLCLVDAKNVLTQLERKSNEVGAVNEAVQQLAFADSVIINKTDLVDDATLQLVKEKIASVNAFAKVVESQKVLFMLILKLLFLFRATWCTTLPKRTKMQYTAFY